MYIKRIGCDETGVGDYFSPLVAAGVFIPENERPFLEQLNLKDSKKITDQKILELANIIKPKVKYSINFFSQEEYNEINKFLNANEIKTLLHLKNINTLEKLYKINEVVIDQFSTTKTLLNYINKIVAKSKKIQKIQNKLILETKAEDKYLEVAAASILAREFLLLQMKQQNEFWNFNFPFGASSKVNLAGKEFVSLFGWESLIKVAKMHFKNTEKIKIL